MDVLKDFFMTMFSPILFWVVYFFDHSPNRHKNLCEYQSRWFMGGAFVLLAGGFLAEEILGFRADSDEFAKIMIISCVVALINIILQFKLSWKSHDVLWNKKVEKFNDWFNDSLDKAFDKAFRDIENERNNRNDTSYDDDKDEQNYSKEYQKQREDFFNQYYSSENELEKALKRLDLPKETTDLKIIKKRYRELAKRYHPDTETGNAEHFKQLVSDFEYIKYELEKKVA